MLGSSSPKGDYKSSRRCNLRNPFTLVSFATLRGAEHPLHRAMFSPFRAVFLFFFGLDP